MRPHILDEERHAVKWAGPQLNRIERRDPIVVDLNHGIEGRIDRGDRLRRRLREFAGAYLRASHELGETQRVMRRILGKLHGRTSLERVQAGMGTLGSRWDQRGW